MADISLEGNTPKSIMDALIVKPEPEVKAKKEPPRVIPSTVDDLDELPDELIDEDEAADLPDEDEIDEAEVEVAPDDQLMEVTVDGEVKQVTLKDLKAAFSGGKFIEKRIQQASEAKNKAEAEYNTLSKTNQEVVAKLQQIDAVLEQFVDQKVDWAELKAKDPLAYALRKEEVREIEDKRKAVQAEIEKVKTQQADADQTVFDGYLKEQAQQLVAKLPDMGDSKKAPKLMDRFVKASAEHYGYTEQELRKVSDHRAFLVLNDAVKYRELLARRKEAQTAQSTQQPQKKVLRVGASSRPVSVQKKKTEQFLNRAIKTGKPEDVAMTLLVGKK